MWKFVLLIIFFPCALQAFWPVCWEFGGEKRFLGPLVSYKEENDETSLTIRPLLFSYDSNEGGVYNFLYPLGRSTEDRSYFLPLYLSKGTSRPDNAASDENIPSRPSDTSLLLYFQGTSSKGAYGGLFPFYGKLYDRFGKDEMGFLMWPFFSYTETDGAKKTNLVWPFFSVYSGTETGFKFWPLFGTKQQEGVKKSSFFLWPLFYKEENYLDSDEPTEKFYAIPFYLSSKSKTRDEQMIMFPLYSYSKDRYREKTKILWPFFSFTKGDDMSGYDFFPLVSSEKREDYSTLSILWPVLYNRSEWFIKERRYTKKRVLLLNRYVDDEKGIFFNIWPVFEHQEKDGHTDVIMPSILPIRSPDVDRIIKPIFTIMEHRAEDNKSMTSFFYGLITNENENDDNWKIRFAFLLELKKESGKIGYEILSGLFGISKSQVKILFIPFKRNNSGGSDIKNSK
jgi:hypothetical protein